MIISEGFSWLHANGEWVEYFEIDSLAKRLEMDYAIVWNYVQKGARSDEQLPKQLTGKTKSRAKKAPQANNGKMQPITIQTVKKHFAPNEIKTTGMTKEDYLKMLEDDKERYKHDWYDFNEESAWRIMDRKG